MFLESENETTKKKIIDRLFLKKWDDKNNVKVKVLSWKLSLEVQKIKKKLEMKNKYKIKIVNKNNQKKLKKNKMNNQVIQCISTIITTQLKVKIKIKLSQIKIKIKRNKMMIQELLK